MLEFKNLKNEKSLKMLKSSKQKKEIITNSHLRDVGEFSTLVILFLINSEINFVVFITC